MNSIPRQKELDFALRALVAAETILSVAAESFDGAAKFSDTANATLPRNASRTCEELKRQITKLKSACEMPPTKFSVSVSGLSDSL